MCIYMTRIMQTTLLKYVRILVFQILFQQVNCVVYTNHISFQFIRIEELKKELVDLKISRKVTP